MSPEDFEKIIQGHSQKLQKHPVSTPEDRSIYVIGSLRNAKIPVVATALRAIGWDAFDDWYSAGPEADDILRDYEKARGNNFRQALAGYAAKHIFEFDKAHLDRCAHAVLVKPAGTSGHLELGYAAGKGKKTYILLEGEPERLDIMVQFANGGIFYSLDEMLETLR